jgi:hypothetical protein
MTKPSIIKPQSLSLTTSQQACVDALTDALEEAMKGKITSLALVVCMADGIAPIMAGTQAGDLMLGIERIKQNILAEIFDRGNVAKSSSILKVQ